MEVDDYVLDVEMTVGAGESGMAFGVCSHHQIHL